MNFQQATAMADRNGETVIPTLCAMCGPGKDCGIYAFVKNGRFLKVAGMDESPNNMGAICAKGQSAPQWVYAPDRLTHPLRRVGEKGEGKFEKISWADAIGQIAETLARQKETYGPESLAILAPSKRTYSDYINRFLYAHGSPNFGHSGICAMQRAFSYLYTVGGYPIPDCTKSDLIIYWGRQPIFAGPVTEAAQDFMSAKTRGTKIIAIKPSMEPDVGMADVWVPIRPGTDAALALAMLHVVVTEDLIDTAFVANWCYGYNRLKKHVQQYSPHWAADITGVPADQVQSVARLYATTKRAAIDLGNGVEHAPSANDAIRAVGILMAITGHLDRTGSNVFPAPTSTKPGTKPITLNDRCTRAFIDKLVGPEFPKVFQPFIEGTASAYYRIFESVLTEDPYPIRTIISPGTQPSVSTRGSKNVLAALKKVDCYIVIDVARTAEMDYADIVIPVATPYESDHPYGGGGNWLMAQNKVIEPLGPYKSIYEFFLELGTTMGYGEDFWNGDLSEAMTDQLEPYGMTLEALRQQPTGVVYDSIDRTYENWATVFKNRRLPPSNAPYLPHGKVEIYNTTFEAAGFTSMPVWREPPESLTGTPELTATYPLLLSDYHTSKNYNASWLRNVPYLREIQPDPTLHIHPDTAAERQIQNGDWIKVESPHGWMKVKTELYPGIRPDTVMILHGWWQGCQALGLDDLSILDGGGNVNHMYSVDPDKAYDPLITAMSSQTLVQVSKWEAEKGV